MKILILNWRSPKDPLAGGAENATFENAKRWVEVHGAEVFWLSPVYDKSIKKEEIAGIQFRYIGLALTRNVLQLLIAFPIYYFLIYWNYLTTYKGKIDVIVDEVHGIPHLTPLYAKEKIVVYIHEVAGDIWDLMYPFPINKLGKLIEKLVFFPYKNNLFVASPSASIELKKNGFLANNKINEVTYGVTAPDIQVIPKKDKTLTIVFLNRLVKMKGPERALEIFSNVHKIEPNSKMIIIGRGESEYEKFLRLKAVELGLSKSVIFAGFVSEKDKFKILSGAHVLLNTSFKEGWGLVNIEANCMGTPVVAYNVPGNDISIKHGISGFLYNEGDEVSMVKKIIELKSESKINSTALKYSKLFSWDKVSQDFYEIFRK